MAAETLPLFSTVLFLIDNFQKYLPCFHSGRKEMWLNSSVYFHPNQILWFLETFGPICLFHEEEFIHLHSHKKKLSIEHKKNPNPTTGNTA